MAGIVCKRPREETQTQTQIQETYEGEDLKRQKSFNEILSLLDEEEEEPNEDVSSIITTLEQEISSSSMHQCYETDYMNQQTSQPTTSTNVDEYASSSSLSSSATSPSFTEVVSKVEEEDGDEEKERVMTMRHLLEASDDELGIPNGDFLGEDASSDGGGFLLCDDAFWEFEDEAANYYTLYQSQLFM